MSPFVVPPVAGIFLGVQMGYAFHDKWVGLAVGVGVFIALTVFICALYIYGEIRDERKKMP